MSYRAFKHLIGETSLERKCRFIFGAAILVLVSGSFWWYARKTERMIYEESLLRTCRMLVNPILVLQHWRDLETLREFVPIIDKTFAQFHLDEVKGYEFRYIMPPGMADTDHVASEFEYEALHAFEQGKAEYRGRRDRRDPSDQRYHYVEAIRVNRHCLSCHPTSRSTAAVLEPGDLMGAVSITIPLAQTQKAINENRAVLIGTAIGTAMLAMIVFYVIVRYVIAKPVKHLKDVSDAVSDGNLNVRADIQTGDEFEELSHAFNRMLRNLIAMQEEFRGVNRELDRKVDELAQANMALFEMNRLKTDFLTTMSHELRTPLNSVIGFSEVLSSSKKLSERERRYAAHIQTSGKMLLGMINDILDLAKIESGNMEIHAEEFSIWDVVEGLGTMTRPMAEQKNIQLRTEIAPDVPVVVQDPGKIQQILYNLLSNALKFTPEGGAVTLSVMATDSDLKIDVADTGIGIAPEDRDRIFEKFRQGVNGMREADSALTRQYTGSGLGLSIVRELCRMLGGEVSLESELGKGSTFTVRLPLRWQPDKQIRGTLPDPRVDLSKARRIDSQVLAASSAKLAE